MAILAGSRLGLSIIPLATYNGFAANLTWRTEIVRGSKTLYPEFSCNLFTPVSGYTLDQSKLLGFLFRSSISVGSTSGAQDAVLYAPDKDNALNTNICGYVGVYDSWGAATGVHFVPADNGKLKLKTYTSNGGDDDISNITIYLDFAVQRA